MKCRALWFVSAFALLTGIEAWSRIDARLLAAEQMGPAPLWFDEFPDPNDPTTVVWPSAPTITSNAEWGVYIESGGVFCSMNVLDGRTESPFSPYGAAFRGSINMTYAMFPGPSGDQAVMVVAPSNASAEPIRAFLPPRQLLADFGVLEGAHLTGTATASGNVTADATWELVLGNAGAGYQSTFHVVSTGRDDAVKVFPFGENYSGGLTLAAGDFDGDGFHEIATGQASLGGRVRLYGWRGDGMVLLGEGAPLGPNHSGGVNLSAFDYNRDGAHDLMVTPRSGRPTGRAFRFKDTGAPRPAPRVMLTYDFFEATRTNGVRVTAGALGDRTFFVATTDNQVRISFLNPATGQVQLHSTSAPFGNNAGPVSAIAVPR